jgi:AcrR family transcriptional regulator
MGLRYHLGMEVPYESTGRRQQKARTRQALVSATRALLTDGVTPTVEEAAAAAGVARTTAYRYFPSQRALLLAAYPEIEDVSLLDDSAPDDPSARLDLVMRAFTAITLEWEPQLRTALRLSLEAGTADGLPLMRQGRAIAWIEDALAPLRVARPELDVHRLAVAIRAATGIEALVWLIDVAGLSRAEAAALLRWSAQALLGAARGGTDGPPPGGGQPGGGVTDGS